MKPYKLQKHIFQIYNPYPRLRSYVCDLVCSPRWCKINEEARYNDILPDSLERNQDSPPQSVATWTRKHGPAQPAESLVCADQRNISKQLYGVVGIKNLLGWNFSKTKQLFQILEKS